MNVSNKFNKANVSALIGAVVTLAVAVWPGALTGEVQAALQTILVTLAVLFIPNKEEPK